jgi:hypothetical protein
MDLDQSNVFSAEDYWRAIVLFGLNTATYKIALGKCLITFAKQAKTSVSTPELSEAFFDLYSRRLVTNKPQLSHPGRLTVMERIVALHNAGQLNRNTAIERVEQDAFKDVLPRFHTLGDIHLPFKFYEHGHKGLVLTDNCVQLFSSGDSDALGEELGSRWDLLEAAFEMKREQFDISNDVRWLYLSRGHERTSITNTRPVLNGYQRGVCFYCGEDMGVADVHVDHVIPRQFIYNDNIWNLVLAHEFCNEQKSDALPGRQYVEKLIHRNELLIGSNHPIKNKLVGQLGSTSAQRQEFVHGVYDDARLVIRRTWQGIRGYDPATDPFYKSFIRRLTSG